MIKLSYELIRNEKDEIKSFVPKDFPTEFSNLVYLKGPNGRGKSFLLHVIAIALYGNHLSDNEIDPGIKRKLDNLLDLDKNKLTFELEISHPTEDFRLISRKKDKNTRDIEVFLLKGGKEIPYPKERFNREFRLLYTIPNNPTQQLPQLLSEIEVSQIELGSRILQFRNYLEGKIGLLEKSRDEETLSSAKKERDKTSSRRKEIENDLWVLRREFEKLEKCFYLNIYLESRSEISDLQNQLIILEKEKTDLEKTVVKRSREVLQSGRKLDQIMKSIETEKNKMMPILAKYCLTNLEQRYSMINESSVIIEIKKPNLQKTIRENLQVFIDTIENLAKSEEVAYETDLASLDLYTSLRNVLRTPRYSGLIIPGTGGDANILLGHIEAAISQIIVIQNRIDGYHQDIRRVRNFQDNINEAINLNKDQPANFKWEPTTEEIRLDELTNKKTLIDQEANTVKRKMTEARENLIKLQIDLASVIPLETQYKADKQLKDFLELPESKQKESVNSIEQKITDLEHQSNQLKIMNQAQTKSIAELEHQEVDHDRRFLPQLKAINRKLVSIESLFRASLSSSLKRIKEKRIESDLDKVFSEIIGEYYAKNMHTVLYVDKEYEVKKVDIVHEVITTTSGKEISFEYLSTGQSQSSYLTTRLGMTDSKKTIALFDEVAMMDETSLAPVISLLRSNYKQGKLLGSIIVQRAEIPTVEEL